jgi:thiol:disulfide interchange protein DsbG
MRVYLMLSIVLLHACAVTDARTTDSDLSKLVASASQGRAHFVKRFAGPSNLLGVVVQGNEPGGRQLVGWATVDGRHLLLGNLFEADGRELTAEAYARQVAAHRATREEFLQQAHRASTVTQFPSGTRTLYVFLDSDCVFCWHLYQEVSQLSGNFQEASVRLQWIIVGTQSAESAARGAAILEQGIDGLIANETRYDSVTARGGIAAAQNTEALAKVGSNTKLLLSSPASSIATPTLLWRSAGGVQVSVGVPDERALRTLLREIIPDE